MMILFWHLLFPVLLHIALALYLWGYSHGVKHTEERWSDAVKRKEASDFRAGFERGRQEKCH